jgi:hypothetical protein
MFWVFDCRQVVNPIPFLQQIYIGQELLLLGVREAQAQNLRPPTQTLLKGKTQAAALPLPENWPMRARRKCTNSKEMAAGVTPEIRDA